MAIEVNKIIHSKRKTLALIVQPDSTLVVRAPLRTSEKAIRQFVEKNRQWIEKHQAKAFAARSSPPKEYRAGELFQYLGSSYPLKVVEDQKQALLLDGEFKLAESAQREAPSVFERWYRQQAKQVLKQRVDLYSQLYGFQYRKIGITSARTRWGSCSTTGSLNFSWRLILAPLEVVDYIVVHELVHTVFHNHSKQFWHKVETIMPDYKEHRKWLRKNAQQILTGWS